MATGARPYGTGATVEIAQAVLVPRGELFELRVGTRAQVLCWA